MADVSDILDRVRPGWREDEDPDEMVEVFTALFNEVARQSGWDLIENGIFPDNIYEEMMSNSTFVRIFGDVLAEGGTAWQTALEVTPGWDDDPSKGYLKIPEGETPLTDDALLNGMLLGTYGERQYEELFQKFSIFKTVHDRPPTESELLALFPSKDSFARRVETAYFKGLSDAGLWPPKTPEYRKYLLERFGVVSDMLMTPNGEPLEGVEEQIDDLISDLLNPDNLPLKESEWRRWDDERKLLTEQAVPAFDRMMAEMRLLTGVSDDVRNRIEDDLLKRFAEAKAQNPASVTAERFFEQNIQAAIQQAQTDIQQEEKTAQIRAFMKAGDYETASRLAGPPPTPSIPEGFRETPEDKAQAIRESQRGQDELEIAQTTEDLPWATEKAAMDRAVTADIPRQLGALATVPGTGQGRVMELSQEQHKAFEKVIGEQAQTFQKYLRREFPSWESPETRRLRQQGAALPGGGDAITGGATFEIFLREAFSGLQAETPEGLQAASTRSRRASGANKFTMAPW
jgi:osmotically-inducible protein OsmY